MPLKTKSLGRRRAAEGQDLWTELGADLAQDDGRAAREHLAAGFPIYFREADTPAGLVIKQYPDGRRELVTFDAQGERKA